MSIVMRHSFVLLALLVAAAAPQARAQSQGSRSVPVLLEPFDISPNGAWRRRAAEVRNLRMRLLQSGDLRALNAAAGGPFRAPSLVAQGGVATAVTGTFHVPVIPIAYKDVDVPYPIADYQRILFSSNPGDRPYTIKTFYEQLTHNRITMDGAVFTPVHTDSVGAFYTDGCNGITVPGFTACPARTINRVAVLMTAALDSISNRPGGDTVWSQFDNDGPDAIPNSGDDDGVVDFVTFLQPEVGGECRSNVPLPTGIWSHRFTIAGWTGQPYVTKTPRRGPGGQPIPGEFIRVNDYTIQSEVGGTTACDGSAIMAVGTVAHETGHAFGLPDLYDTRGSTQGIGGWGLMGSGNYARPYSPSSYDAWSLNALGWATVDTLGTSRVVTTGARLLSDTIYYARTNDFEEFVLVENRQAVLSDTAQMNPALSSQCPATLGFCAKSPGLLFWLIDQPRVQIGLLSNTVNVGPLQGVELIQADGFNDLRTSGARNRGDRGDSYPGSTNNTKLVLLSNPSARDNSGDYLGFTIDAIQQLPQGAMRFRFNRRAPTVVQAPSGAQVRVNGTAWGRFEEVVPAGDQLQLVVDDPQLIAAGKTRARFLSWSQGGPRDQLFTSSASPDTLSALFAFEHRLTVITSGGGTVASSVAGDLTQGAFFSAGTHVTLTAATPTGFLFVGWRGDTVATAPTLELTLTRGYDLEARFIPQVLVASADAVSDLLGTPKLSDAQRVYLDELGNRNGTFDVGDLLAMYRLNGLAVPPSLLQAAAAATPRRIRERRP
jgi:M6 family metalloprotease-like protein